MNETAYLADADALMAQISQGAFLTVKAGEEINTMTIGWATIGFIWKKKVFMVAVRNSRHTFSLLEKTDNFTVTVPTAGEEYRKALALCGTKSGRDLDKFAECRLGQRPGRISQSPIVDIPARHYECAIIYKSAMDPAFLHEDLAGLYPQHDYHTLYFGEILACYETV